MFINELYFALKPWLPRRLAIGVRRLRARWILSRNGHAWPIHVEAGRKPANWSGWPGAKQFALILTHDVEGPRGLERVESLARAEMKLGFRSSFNLVPEGAYRAPDALRHFLTSNGFEVGVHDLHHDGKLYSSREEFRAKATRINAHLQAWGAVGFRSGFMLHNLDWLRDLEIQYDASTFDTDPFEPQPDGVSTIFPFWVPRDRQFSLPDLIQRGAPPAPSDRGYLELPYTLPQDITLFGMLRQQTADLWKRKLHWIAEQGGMALVNVHPDYISFHPRDRNSLEFPVATYEDFLAYVRDSYPDQFWAALPKEMAAWWKTRQKLPGCSAAAVA